MVLLSSRASAHRARVMRLGRHLYANIKSLRAGLGEPFGNVAPGSMTVCRRHSVVYGAQSSKRLKYDEILHDYAGRPFDHRYRAGGEAR
jgi:hypothetical protein